MKDIRYPTYPATVHQIADEVAVKLEQDKKLGIDIDKPSVEVITYNDFLTKSINDKNYYNIFRSMTENIMGSNILSADETVNRMFNISQRLENNCSLNSFDLLFCELLINPFAFSFYYTTEDINWPKGVIFCLNERLDKDAQYVWGNEPFYYWLGAQAVLFENVEDLRNAVIGMFKKISSEDTFNKFKVIYPKFKCLSSKYLDEHKQELLYDNLDEYKQDLFNDDFNDTNSVDAHLTLPELDWFNASYNKARIKMKNFFCK